MKQLKLRVAFTGIGESRFSDDDDEAFRRLVARILNLAPTQVVGSSERGSGDHAVMTVIA